MPKEIKNITDRVMDQIHNDKLKMRPRIYFIAGSFFTFIGLISSVIISIFFIGLINFSLRVHGPMGEYRFSQILASFPWWALILAVAGFVVGIWLLRRYDFSYKINFKIIIVVVLLAIITSAWVVDAIGLNDILFRRGPMKGIMRQYLQDTNIQEVPGCCRNLKNQ
jgi:magnesium-transporting ATPase (P-type)